MCDCYVARCEQPGCLAEVPVHIGDFRHPEKSVHVRCHRHPPLLLNGAAPGWEAFVVIEQVAVKDHGPVIYMLCDELESPSADDVCPNIGATMAVAKVKDYEQAAVDADAFPRSLPAAKPTAEGGP